MDIFYSRKAVEDLRDLEAWLALRSDRGFLAVAKRLELELAMIREHPMAGRRSTHAGMRDIVETRYGFIISYIVLNNAVFIVRITHARRRPPA